MDDGLFEKFDGFLEMLSDLLFIERLFFFFGGGGQTIAFLEL